MSNCYKCGRDLPETQVECEDGCRPYRPSGRSHESVMRDLQEKLNRRLKLDWSKVKTFEDMMLVVSTIFAEATIDPDCEAAQKLAAFLIKPSGAEPTNPT